MCPSERNLSRASVKNDSGSDLRSAFEVIDADRDGKISREDLRRFYAGFSNGSFDDEEMIGTMISLADSNRDGFVEYEEFERVLGGGTVNNNKKSYMNMAGFSASDEDIKAMIKLVGGDEIDGVSFDTLLKILAVDLAG
ncbi:hypothetical protein REPUB_Repub20aG0140400 [Reevesia pubescens]